MKRAVSLSFICLLVFSYFSIPHALADFEDELRNGSTLILESGMLTSISVNIGQLSLSTQEDMYILDLFVPIDTVRVAFSFETGENYYLVDVSNYELIPYQTTEAVITVSTPDRLTEEVYTVYIHCGTYEALLIGLSYLDVKNGVFSPMFNRYRVAYYGVLPENFKTFSEAGVQYTLYHQEASVTIACKDAEAAGIPYDVYELPLGKRTQYVITVQESEEDGGRSRNYYLYLFRKDKSALSLNQKTKLSNVKINGGAVPLAFKSNQSYYEVTVPSGISKIDVEAYAIDRSNIVYILGPNLTNTTDPTFQNILVTTHEGTDYSIYTIRLVRDDFMKTPRHTHFQMMAFCLGFLAGGCAIGSGAARLLNRRGKSPRAKRLDRRKKGLRVKPKSLRKKGSRVIQRNQKR